MPRVEFIAFSDNFFYLPLHYLYIFPQQRPLGWRNCGCFVLSIVKHPMNYIRSYFFTRMIVLLMTLSETFRNVLSGGK